MKRDFFKYIAVSAFLSCSATIGLNACKSFVRVDPPINQLVNSNIFNSDGSALSAMLGIYSRMTTGSGFASGGANSLTVLCGLSADEFVGYSPDLQDFYNNNLTPVDGIVSFSLWAEAYQYIYSANAILEGLESSTGLSENTKRQLIGEAKFVRSFCFYHLTCLFGDVPLPTTTDYKTNSTTLRIPQAQVLDQIIRDLLDAIPLLSEDYSTFGQERVRPNKYAAASLLARTYLLASQWDKAEAQASFVIQQSSLYSLELDLNHVFLKNSREAIWQLPPVQPDVNTREGQNYILTEAPTNVTLSTNLITSIEDSDARKANWVRDTIIDGTQYYYPFKYKIKISSEVLEYSMVIRLAELYLIRAEARTQLNNLAGGLSDLNVIRARAGLPNLVSLGKDEQLRTLEHERQIELFSEWGHRWMDLKRLHGTNGSRADEVLAPIKEGNWQPTDKLYPIPEEERINNINITQNPGY